jgi:hypothetical protein
VCLLLLAVPPARAELHPAAADTWKRTVDATGGAEARANEVTLHLKGRAWAAGLSGTWEMWLGAPDRWVRSFRLGPLRLRQGFDGTTAWRTDLSGLSVVVLSSDEADDMREEGWFLNERWALPDQGGGLVKAGSRAYTASATYDVLVVTPPAGGSPRRLFVNAKTSLIDRTTQVVGQFRVAEDRPGNYRMLAGRKRAGTYTAPTLLPTDKPVEKITVDSVWVNPSLDSAAFSPPRLPPRSIAWQRAHGAVRAPFAYTSQSVVVRASINGAPPEDFILDTGASLTALDMDYAASIGLRAEGESAVQGISATAGMRFAKVRSISLDASRNRAATLRDFRVALVDISQGAKVVLWRKPVGLLGADFLSRFAVTLDFDSLTVTLEDPAGWSYRGQGAAIPFELNGGVPVVPMTIDGNCTGKFMVDVGNSFHFVMYGSSVRSCDMWRKKKRTSVEVYGGGLGGGFVSSLCRLDSLRIGPYMWARPVAALSLASGGSVGSQDLAGNIGCGVLEKFRCTFDYAGRVLYLEPGSRFGQPEKVSRLGAMLARVGTTVYAGNVINGSAAYEAGIRWFDEIVSIDGRPIEEWTREQVDRELEEGPVGSVHTITYRRMDDDPKTVEVTLRDVL